MDDPTRTSRAPRSIDSPVYDPDTINVPPPLDANGERVVQGILGVSHDDEDNDPFEVANPTGTPIPFVPDWRISSTRSDGGTYRFELAHDELGRLVVEFSLVNTLVTPPTSRIDFWLPGESEPYRERSVNIGDSRALRSIVMAWKEATGNTRDGGVIGGTLLPILRRLSDLVLRDSETEYSSVNLSTARASDHTLRVMFEPNLIDEQLTSFFGQPGAGKSKVAIALAIDISHKGSESFLGFRYAKWRPVLYVDWEEIGEAGQNVFFSQVEAVCHGAGIDRSEIAVHYLQPKSTFARALPEIIAVRNQLTNTYGVEPITIVDSVTRATGGSPKSTEAWAEFDNAIRHYGSTTIAIDHEVKSQTGGVVQGASTKTASYRHTVYTTMTGNLLSLRSKKSNRISERDIASFHVDVVRDSEGLVRSVRYTPMLSPDQGSGLNRRARITNSGVALMWAHLTDEPITSKSFDDATVLTLFGKESGSSIRNSLTNLTRDKLLTLLGSGLPNRYGLTDGGAREAESLLAQHPDIRDAYEKTVGQSGSTTR